MTSLFVPIVLTALFAASCTNGNMTPTVDVKKPPGAHPAVPGGDTNVTTASDPSPESSAAVDSKPPPTLSVSRKTTAEDIPVSFVDADVQASSEAQGSGALYSFEQSSLSGIKCSDHGAISEQDSTTGAFVFTPAANWNGSCNILVGFDNGNGASVASIFSVSVTAIADVPTAPASVALSPTTADSSATLTCTPLGALDPDGDAVAYEYRWYVNMGLVAGQTASTLTAGFAKGQGVYCEARSSDVLLQSAYVSSPVVTIQNVTPAAPSTATITSATPTREGGFSCGYAGGSDADSDSLTPVYAWAVDGTVVAGQTSSTLSGSNMTVVRGSSVTCAVKLTDGTSMSAAATSMGITVLNSALTQSCTWSGGAIGASHSLDVGVALSSRLVCGASDADATDTLIWSVSGCSSNFSVNASTGVFSGAMQPSQCTLGVSVTDGTGTATTSVKLVPQGGANPLIAGDVFSVVAHPDGDVLMGGNFSSIGGEATDRLLVLEANGDRDTRFLGFDDEVRDVYAYADGRLLVVGVFTRYGTTPVPNIVRLNADGSLDATFKLNIGLANDEHLHSVDVHLDSGRIYIAGSFDHWNGQNVAGVVALNPDGTRYTDFYAGSGVIAANGTETAWPGVYDFFFDPNQITLDQANEYAYVSGNFDAFGGVGAKKLARFDGRGYLDQRFTKATGPNVAPGFVAFNNVTGKLILTGDIDSYAGEDTNNKEVLYISNTNALDTAVQAAKGTLVCSHRARIEPVSGDVLVFGCWDQFGPATLETHSGYVRLTASGAISASSHENSDDRLDPADGFVDSNGRTVLVGGVSGWNGNASFSQGIFRLTAAGALDASFDVGGGIPVGPNRLHADPQITKPMPNGRVAVAGEFRNFRSFTEAWTIAKFNPLTGVIDTSFMANAHAERATMSIVVDSVNSKIYFGGEFDSFADSFTYKGVARTNLEGQVDMGYVVGKGECFDVYAMALAPAYSGDANVLNDLHILGDLDAACSAPAWGIWRLNADATKDTNFTSNEFSTYDSGTSTYTAGQTNEWDRNYTRGYDMAFDTNTGRLYVAGPITKYASRVTKGIVAIASDGTVVANGVAAGSFDIGEGLHDQAQRVLMSGTDVFFAGRFDRFRDMISGYNATGLVRLASNGSNVFSSQNDVPFDSTDMVLSGTTLYVVGSTSNYQGTGATNGIVALDASNGARRGSGVFTSGSGFGSELPRFVVKTTINSTTYLFVTGALTTYRGNKVNGSVLIGLDGSFVH